MFVKRFLRGTEILSLWFFQLIVDFQHIDPKRCPILSLWFFRNIDDSDHGLLVFGLFSVHEQQRKAFANHLLLIQTGGSAKPGTKISTIWFTPKARTFRKLILMYLNFADFQSENKSVKPILCLYSPAKVLLFHFPTVKFNKNPLFAILTSSTLPPPWEGGRKPCLHPNFENFGKNRKKNFEERNIVDFLHQNLTNNGSWKNIQTHNEISACLPRLFPLSQLQLLHLGMSPFERDGRRSEDYSLSIFPLSVPSLQSTK